MKFICNHCFRIINGEPIESTYYDTFVKNNVKVLLCEECAMAVTENVKKEDIRQFKNRYSEDGGDNGIQK